MNRYDYMNMPAEHHPMLADVHRKSASVKKNVVTDDELLKLGEAAWRYRENALIFGKTKVGAAILTRDGHIYGGCNVGSQYRNGDIHAEVCAIGNMVAGQKVPEEKPQIKAIVVAAERTLFTPCGGCMNWVMQFGGRDCVIGFQSAPGAKVLSWRGSEMMPEFGKSYMV